MASLLRILHVIPSIDTPSGGPSRAVFDLALAAQARGHLTTICTTDFGGPSDGYTEYIESGIKLFVFPVQGPPLLQYSAGMREYIHNNVASFDIVHLHSVYLPSDWMVYRSCLARGVPYILRPHGTFDPIIRERKRLRKWIAGKLFQDRVTAAAAGIHYTSDDERTLSNCEHSKAWIVPLPIRAEEFAGEPDQHFRTRYGLEHDFLLFLGRLAWKKGIDIAIQAFDKFAQQHDQVDLLIAGPDDGEETRLRAMVRDLRLESRVRFTGMLDGSARIAAYQCAKLFLLPSRGENFGRTVAEAMVTGTPILMSDRIGIWKDIVDADAGCVVEADADSVLAGLNTIWNSYPKALERSARARKLVEARFSIEKVGEQLEGMYHEAMLAGRDATARKCG